MKTRQPSVPPCNSCLFFELFTFGHCAEAGSHIDVILIFHTSHSELIALDVAGT